MTELELVPSRRRRGAAYLTAVMVGAFFTFGGTAGAGTPGLLAGLGFTVFALGIVHLHLRKARIEITGSQIIVHGALVTRRRERSRAASVVRATVVPVRGPAVDTVFIRGADDSLLLRVHGSNYDPADLDKLIAHLDLPVSGPPHSVTAGELGRSYPQILPWVERHPIKLVFAILGGGLVALLTAAGIVAAVR